jgi:hypothetical protein
MAYVSRTKRLSVVFLPALGIILSNIITLIYIFYDTVHTIFSQRISLLFTFPRWLSLLAASALGGYIVLKQRKRKEN